MHGIEIDFTKAPSALDSLSSGPVGFFVGRGKRETRGERGEFNPVLSVCCCNLCSRGKCHKCESVFTHPLPPYPPPPHPLSPLLTPLPLLSCEPDSCVVSNYVPGTFYLYKHTVQYTHSIHKHTGTHTHTLLYSIYS